MHMVARSAPDHLLLHWILGKVTPRATHYGGPDPVRSGSQKPEQKRV